MSPVALAAGTSGTAINGGKNGGYRQDIVFIPGYRDGQEPFGVWTPARLIVARGGWPPPPPTRTSASSCSSERWAHRRLLRRSGFRSYYVSLLVRWSF